MNAPQIIQEIEAAGGVLALKGDKITFDVPKDALPLVEILRAHKPEAIRLLRARMCPIHGDRASWWTRADGFPVCGICHPDPFALAVEKTQTMQPPSMPQGVRLLEWNPKQPPLALTSWAVVVDVPLFIRTTLTQLEHAIQGRAWQSGHWSVRELVDRLDECGVRVEVDECERQQP